MASAKIPELEIAADITIDSMEQLADYKEYISPKEGRRMGKLMKAATLTSLMALREAGIECPDAIITATANGMLETSEKFLVDMVDNGVYRNLREWLGNIRINGIISLSSGNKRQKS